METLTGHGGGGNQIVCGVVRKTTPIPVGDILVTEYTDPSMLADILRASAVVTNVGGALCHAAIVCREANIPFVVGTSHATKWLKHGDLVEVNPVEGTVKLIE